MNLTFQKFLVSFITKNGSKRILKESENGINIQYKTLNYLLKKAEFTSFGKEYNFNKIKTYNDFKISIPVRNYEEFFPYINRIRNGEHNVLWPQKITWFAKSSGTTNNISKYIPVSKDALYDCHFKAGKDMISIYNNNFPSKNIYNGKGIMLGGSINTANQKDYIDGDLSAILIHKFPFWVNKHRVPDIETSLMQNWELKLEKIVNQSIKENITNLTGVPSWMLILLKKVLEVSKKKNILEVWPNLEVYFHGGVNFEPYREQFNTMIPSTSMNYLEGYNASEGFFAVQDKNPSKGMLLLINHGIFYEFFEVNKLNNSEKNIINIEDVQLDINYAIIITTNSGLWRYMIGDVIKFISINPYRIKIVGRTKSFINTFGEELMVHNTDKAILETCKKLGCQIIEYTVAPIYISTKSGGHQWFIEFGKKPENLTDFINVLDKNLRSINSDYAAKRFKNLILKKPEIICLENNEFYIWLKNNNRLGGQIKIPRLNNDRIFAEEILSIHRSFQQND